MKLVLGTEVGLSPGDFVLDGDSVPFPKSGRSPLPNFRPISIVVKRLDASKCHLVWMLPSALDEDPVLPPQQRGRSPLPIFGPFLLCPNGWMHQDATRYGDIGLSQGEFVLDGCTAPSPKGAEPHPQF